MKTVAYRRAGPEEALEVRMGTDRLCLVHRKRRGRSWRYVSSLEIFPGEAAWLVSAILGAASAWLPPAPVPPPEVADVPDAPEVLEELPS